MDKKANDTFAFDLENRLDDFFNDALPDQKIRIRKKPKRPMPKFR